MSYNEPAVSQTFELFLHKSTGAPKHTKTKVSLVLICILAVLTGAVLAGLYFGEIVSFSFGSENWATNGEGGRRLSGNFSSDHLVMVIMGGRTGHHGGFSREVAVFDVNEDESSLVKIDTCDNVPERLFNASRTDNPQYSYITSEKGLFATCELKKNGDFFCLPYDRYRHRWFAKRKGATIKGISSRPPIVFQSTTLLIALTNDGFVAFDIVGIKVAPLDGLGTGLELPRNGCVFGHGRADVYFIGGTFNGSVTGAVKRLRLTSATSIEIRDLEGMNFGRKHQSCGLVDSEVIFVAGGIDENGKQLKSVEYFNLTSGDNSTWTNFPPLKKGRSHASNIGLIGKNGRLIITGGIGENGHILEDAEIFNSAENEWKNISLNASRADKYDFDSAFISYSQFCAKKGQELIFRTSISE